MVLKENATGGTTTGGTDITFNTDGVDVKNGIHVGDMATSFATRTNITFKTRNPSLQSDGSYTKAKRTMSLSIPKTLADSSTSFQVVRIEAELHPECTTAEVTNIRMLAAQLLTDSDTLEFFNNGSLS
jgi:hypothetical protein